MTADKIADFFIDEGEGLFSPEQRDDLIKAIEGHIKYGTIKVLTHPKTGEVTAAIRWNWNEDDTVHVLDAAVKEEYRGTGLFDALTVMCVKDNPRCKGVHFQDKGLKRSFYKEASYYLNKEKPR